MERNNHHEEERISEGKVSISADRREDQGAWRLAGQDALPDPHIDQASRPRGGRGVEVERGSGVVARWIDLHGRDLQERREDDLRQRRGLRILRAYSTPASMATPGVPSTSTRARKL